MKFFYWLENYKSELLCPLYQVFFVIFYARDSRRYSNNCIIAFFLLRRIKKNVFLMSRKRRSRKRRRSWTCIHRLLWFILIILFLFSCKHGDVANWAPHLSIHHASTTTTMYQWTLWTMIFVDVKHYQTKMYMLPGILVNTLWKVKILLQESTNFLAITHRNGWSCEDSNPRFHLCDSQCAPWIKVRQMWIKQGPSLQPLNKWWNYFSLLFSQTSIQNFGIAYHLS